MAFETRALTGTMLARRYVVGELQRENEVATQFRGEDTRTGRAVNVDVVREGLDARSNASKTLEREAMIACEIRHPNVATPSDVGVLEDGSTFVITPCFTGETLEDRVCLSGSLPVGDVVRIGLDLLSALAAAHDLEITHGDLRPESVFLVERDGLVLQTLLSGFGHGSRGARGGSRGFTNLAFVAPEVAAGEAPTVSSDLYACGALLYLAATGYLPYTAPSAAELSEAVRDGWLRAPSGFRPELPARLVRVLVQALQADPTRRFASARDMLHALEVARGAFGPAYAGSSNGYESRANRPANDLVHRALEETRVLSPDALRAEAIEPAMDRWSSSDIVPSLLSLVDSVPSDLFARAYASDRA